MLGQAEIIFTQNHKPQSSLANARPAYGVVVDNELHRLDDASNEMVAAAVADTGPEANWFVTISGERGDDGHVSIDRIDRGLPGNRRWCFRCTACGTLVCCGLKDCDDD